MAIASAPSLDGRVAAHLLDRWPEPGAVRRATPAKLARAGAGEAAARALGADGDPALAAGLRWLSGAADRGLVCAGEDAYPAHLLEIPDPPAALWIAGDPAALSHPQIAIVGSRSATHGGLELAFDFARTLASRGLAVTSGLAAGIDSAAHLGALDADGLTLAVFGCGIDRVFPSMNHDLARRVARDGACVSEYPPGAKPHAGRFPRRNRIISGLSLGVLVVEAGRRSGALITARCAGEQGRDVFAIPGSIHNPLTRGCHRLIRDGAKLVESVDDVLEELAAQIAPLARAIAASPSGPSGARSESSESAPDPACARLLDVLEFDPVTVDTLVDRAGLTPEEVSSMLLKLELQGLVKPLPGGVYMRLTTRRAAARRPEGPR